MQGTGKLVQRLEITPVAKMILASELTTILNLSEEQFSKLIQEIEKEELFNKLAKPVESNDKPVISYEKFPGCDISRNFFEFKEEISTDEGDVDIQSVLSQKDDVVGLIKHIGMDKFKEYFIYNHEIKNINDIAEECNISVEEAQKISKLMDEVTIHSEFFHASSLNITPGVQFNKIASIEETQPGKFQIGYFSTRYLRGKYKIDYERLETLKHTGFLSSKEISKLRHILKTLELINCRKDNLYRIIKRIIEVQNGFLNTRDIAELQPYTQRDLSDDLGLSPSIVCRTIRERSIETQWGEEMPIKDFLPHIRQRKQRLVKQILEEFNWDITDQKVSREMDLRYGIKISRRTANWYKLTLISQRDKNKREEI